MFTEVSPMDRDYVFVKITYMWKLTFPFVTLLLAAI